MLVPPPETGIFVKILRSNKDLTCRCFHRKTDLGGRDSRPALIVLTPTTTFILNYRSSAAVFPRISPGVEYVIVIGARPSEARPLRSGRSSCRGNVPVTAFRKHERYTRSPNIAR